MKIIRTSTVPLSLNILLKGQLKFLSQKFEVIGISSEGSDLEDVKKREGIKTISVNMERGISPLKDFMSLVKLYKVINKEKPLIVHSITPKAGLISMLAAKAAGTPIRLHTFTGLIFPTKKGFTQKLLIYMDRILCMAATNIYPEGKGVKKDLERFKITSKPLKILANGNVNGIDLEYFKIDSISSEITKLKIELKIQPTDFVFIFVGRLVGDKGINELVEAFSQLHAPNSKLLLVGPLEFELDPIKPETFKEIENNPKIISVGFQADVRPYFAVSDVLVFPSYREGFPNVVIQAGAMGLPSIVSDINGSNEIIIGEKNGTIVPVKDVATLKKAMQKIIDDKNYYNSLKINARKMIESRYEQSVVWNALVDEYQILLKQKNLHV